MNAPPHSLVFDSILRIKEKLMRNKTSRVSFQMVFEHFHPLCEPYLYFLSDYKTIKQEALFK